MEDDDPPGRDPQHHDFHVAVFIDGCFWHGCPDHYRAPASNVSYWEAKVTRNRNRDTETSASLVSAGWTVLRFWGHEDPAAISHQILIALERV
ncbi:DNA mismatch endonuclease Vsr [Arthrobacter sp. GAS37]